MPVSQLVDDTPFCCTNRREIKWEIWRRRYVFVAFHGQAFSARYRDLWLKYIDRLREQVHEQYKTSVNFLSPTAFLTVDPPLLRSIRLLR